MIIALLALLSLQEQQADRDIPSAYRGVWDVSQAFCDEAVSDMRLGVGSEQFTIYRDQFRVEKVRPKNDGSLLLSVSSRSHDDFDNQGFGQPYDVEWKLSDGGRQLTMSRGKAATTWRRCANKG